MHASRAKSISNEPWYYRQIRAVAGQGRTDIILEFNDKATAEKVKEILLENGYVCGKIKQHNDMMGDDFTLNVSWQ